MSYTKILQDFCHFKSHQIFVFSELQHPKVLCLGSGEDGSVAVLRVKAFGWVQPVADKILLIQKQSEILLNIIFTA